MLKGIDPLLNGDLLKVLDDMGHSDTIAIVDANFPAHRVHDRVIDLPGVGIVPLVEAIVSVLPLDVEIAPKMMESNLDPRPAVEDEIQATVGGRECEMIDRWAYYYLVKNAYAVVSTGEMRLWANIVLYKGLVTDPADPSARQFEEV